MARFGPLAPAPHDVSVQPTPAEVAFYCLIAIRAPRLLTTAVGIPSPTTWTAPQGRRYSVCLLQRAATSLVLSATCTWRRQDAPATRLPPSGQERVIQNEPPQGMDA